MRYFVNIFVCAVVYITLTDAMPDEMKELLDNLHKTCTGNTGVGEDLIENARKGDFSEDSKLKCYMRCVIDELGLIDGGVVDIEGMIAMLPDELKDDLGPILRKCTPSNGADECDTAWLLHKCTYFENPSLFFLP